MKSNTQALTWFLYRSIMNARKWHAFQPGCSVSICGHVAWTDPYASRFEKRLDDLPPGELPPSHQTCCACGQRVEKQRPPEPDPRDGLTAAGAHLRLELLPRWPACPLREERADLAWLLRLEIECWVCGQPASSRARLPGWAARRLVPSVDGWLDALVSWVETGSLEDLDLADERAASLALAWSQVLGRKGNP